ncbi:unnamed protein product, partial [Ectocarpus sp. 12 AP-2014]
MHQHGRVKHLGLRPPRRELRRWRWGVHNASTADPAALPRRWWRLLSGRRGHRHHRRNHAGATAANAGQNHRAALALGLALLLLLWRRHHWREARNGIGCRERWSGGGAKRRGRPP